MDKESTRKATRRDVALHAGVSTATVSYVMNSRTDIKISQATRERVWQSARLLNYCPSYIGTALTSRRSFNIGVLFKSLHHLHYHLYREILIGAGMKMEDENYHMLFFFRSSGSRFQADMGAGRADGIFVIQSDSDIQSIIQLAENHIPTVAVNFVIPDLVYENAGMVIPDIEGMLREAVGQFISMGKKDIALVNLHTVANETLNGTFFRICGEHAPEGVRCSFLERTEPDVFAETLRMLISEKRSPDAFFINRIQYAEIACRVFAEAGLVPGRDVLIAACEPDEELSSFPYALTLYYWDGKRIGECAWGLMKKILSHENIPGEIITVPFRRQIFL